MGTYTALPNLYLPEHAGAPLASGVNNTAGELITLLDAILVNGYGSVTLSSLVVASGVATATVSTGHGFANVGSIGPVVLVEGATPSGLNGSKRIYVTSATAFTLAAAGISDQTASGTITAKMAPAGWTKAFSATNKAVYRPASGLRHYLRVDDTIGAYARVLGYVAMSDVDTGTEPFPTDAQVSGGLYSHKSTAATRRPWIAVADERSLYLFMDAAGSLNYFGLLVWIEVVSALPGDAYRTVLNAISSTTASTGNFYTFNSAAASQAGYAPRGISQVGTAVACSRMRAGHNTANPGVGGEVTPVDCGFRRFHQCESWDGLSVFRGWLPGLFATSHQLDFAGVLEAFDGPLQGRTLYTLGQTGVMWQMDITGPWYDD